jgi:hypothetical protein
MSQFQIIKDEQNVYAYIVRASTDIQGVNFVTPDENNFQLATSEYTSEQKVKAHVHLSQDRVVKDTQECIFIVKGETEVTIYSDKTTVHSKHSLTTGDVILFVSGGHGMTFSKNTRLVEVKQGPYFGFDKDKELIE